MMDNFDHQAGEVRSVSGRVVSTGYNIGQIVIHKEGIFRGVIYDIDSRVSDESVSSEEDLPPDLLKQAAGPFYHIIAETGDLYYMVYASEESIEPDCSEVPLNSPHAIQFINKSKQKKDNDSDSASSSCKHHILH